MSREHSKLPKLSIAAKHAASSEVGLLTKSLSMLTCPYGLLISTNAGAHFEQKSSVAQLVSASDC